MSADRARPWWASDGPVDGGVDRGVDPIDRHRAARRGELPADPRPASSPPAPDDPRPPEPARHRVDACGVCPFCTSMRLLQDTRPELVEHLTEAARHLAAAARSLLDTPVPDSSERAPRPSARRTADDARRWTGAGDERLGRVGGADDRGARPAAGDGRLHRIVLDDPPTDPPAPAGGR